MGEDNYSILEAFERFLGLGNRDTVTPSCDCACHVTGIYGGTECPSICSNHNAKFDGCHRCGCPGTKCIIGECVMFDWVRKVND